MIYREAISKELGEIITRVFNSPLKNNFRLCGGTALALQCGHRISVDADFVSEKNFERQEIIQAVSEIFLNVTDVHTGTHGVFLRSENIKVDFLTWKIPFMHNAVEFENWKLVSLEEIAAMKLFAITQRGEKKDYFDIAELLNHFSLMQLFNFYKERHPQNDLSVLARFIVSFSDFENQPDPVMLNEMNWEKCKTVLQHSIKDYLQQ